jgi:hypothetical protein
MSKAINQAFSGILGVCFTNLSTVKSKIVKCENPVKKERKI